MKTCYYPFCKANASTFSLILKRSMNKEVVILVSFLTDTTTDTTTSSRRERANTSRPHSLVTQRSQGRDSRGISWQNLLECCWLAFSLAAEFLYLVDAPPPPHQPRLVLEPLVSIISQGSLMASKATDKLSPYFVQLRGHLLWPCGLCQKKN